MSTKPKKLLPEFKFKIPVKYDTAFRSRIENERLRKAHPKVKKIHVRPRNEKNSVGNINVFIAAPNKKIAENCYLDGKKTIERKKMNNKKGTHKNGTHKNGTHKNGTNKKGTHKNGTNKKGTNKKGTNKNGLPKNSRPLVEYPEDVTSSTNWGEYESRRTKYQQNHPDWKIV